MIHGTLSSILQVIERGQITLLRTKSSAKNILTTGYRLVSCLTELFATSLLISLRSNASKGNDRKGLITYFVNTTITAFYSPEWSTLYERQVIHVSAGDPANTCF